MAGTPFNDKCIQGFNTVWTHTIVDGNGNPITTFTGSEPLICEVWTGGTQAVLFNPVATWNQPALATIDVTYSAANTSAIQVGFYDVLIFRTDTNVPLAFGYLNVASAPGTTGTDLTTIPFVRAALSDFSLTQTQIDYLPTTITAASQAMVRWLGDRDIIQQNYIEYYDVYLDGTVMLKQVPVNYVSRVQASPDTAITILNLSTSVQEAWVSAAITGDFIAGQTITGLILTWISNGVQSSTTTLFTPNQTIGSLGSIINAYGFGWSAVVNTAYSQYAVTELINLEIPQGATNSTTGCQYSVFAEDMGGNAVLEPNRTGLLWIGRQYKSLGPQWGPDWMEFDSPERLTGRVKVSYNAGYGSVPVIIQKVVASTAKNMLTILAIDQTVESERAEQYDYTLSKEIELLSKADRQALAFYRIHHA